MAQRISLAAGVVLAAAVVTGCAELGGGGSLVVVSPGASPGEVASGNACSLVTADEVWGITNSDKLVAVQDPQIPSRCVYATSTATGTGAASIDWQPTSAEKRFEGFRSDSTGEAVDGIGDEAFRFGDRLLVRLGDQSFDIQVQWGSNDGRQAAGLVIAKVIVARVTGQPVPAGLIPTPAPVLSAKDPCLLLTNEAAADVLETKELSSYNNDSGGSNQPLYCYYSLADGTAVLTTYLDPKGGFDDWPAILADMNEPQVIEGLGDKAAFEAYSGKLWVLYGDAMLMANAYTSAPEGALEADRKVMEILLANIQVP